MQKLFFTLLLMILVLLVACRKDKDDNDNNQNTSSEIILTPSSGLSFDFLSESKTFTINSNTTWTINTDEEDSWCSFSQTSGSAGVNEITVTVKMNTRATRTVVLTIQTSSIHKTYTITQAAIPDGYDGRNVVAGELEEALTDINHDHSQIKNLILEGSLNEKDMETLARVKNSLQILDISRIESMPNIKGGIFSYSQTLSEIHLPSLIDKIGSQDDEVGAFAGCSALKNVTIGLKQNLKSKSIKDDGSNKYISIGAHAFDNCTALSSINKLDNVSVIGYKAFNNCTKLTYIGALSCAIDIQDYAFYGCSSLAAIGTLSLAAKIGNYAFAKCKSLVGVSILSVATIGNSAFAECELLSLFVCPYASGTLGHNAFYKCKWLTVIDIPKGITEIGNYAFYGCNLLKDITIPFGVTRIGDRAFEGCIMNTLEFPSSLRLFGGMPFHDCKNLTSVYSHAVDPPESSGPLFEQLTYVYVPVGAKDYYEISTGFSGNNIVEVVGM